MITMTTHHFGMATHLRLSRAVIVGYSVVSHDNHMQATWCESDWRIDIQNKSQKALDVYKSWGVMRVQGTSVNS